MIGTFALASWWSFRNRVLARVRRLRQPRYLISLIVGILYFAGIFLRKGSSHGVRWGMPAGTLSNDFFLLLLTVLAAVPLLGAWALPGSSAGLRFREAEIQFLFPAPLSRRQLLVYRLVHAQSGILISAFFVTLFGLRGAHFLGVWVAFAVLDVYTLMVSFARARLKLAGIGWIPRLVAVIVAVAGIVAAGAVTLRPLFHTRTAGGGQAVAAAFIHEGARLLFSWPMSAITFLPSLFARAASAPGYALMFLWLLPLLLLGVVFFWVAARLDVSFEDASLERSRKRAAELEQKSQQRRGRRIIARSMPAPFRLLSTGRPEVAIVWKNLIAAGRVSLPAVVIPVGLLILVFGISSGMGHHRVAFGILSAGCFIIAAVMTLAGPMTFRNDLREDFDRFDLLKVFPLTGAQVVGAEIAAPAIIIFALQLTLSAAGSAAMLGTVGAEKWLRLLPWLPAVLVVAFPVNLLQLLFQNAAILLLPGWASMTREEARGLEATGRGLLLLLGNLLLLAVGLLPAAIAFLGGFWVGHYAFSWDGRAALVGAIAAAFLLFAEVGYIVRFLGGQFEEIDVANDVGVSAI